MGQRVLIGLGSNVGDRRAYLDFAVAQIAMSPGVVLHDVSPYHLTKPVGGPAAQGAFLNAALSLSTSLVPDALLKRLQEIEVEAGRVRVERWGERTLDLDLLLFAREILESGPLRVPHPFMAVRRFVLAPLAEIAADAIDPITGLSIAELLANLDRRPSWVAISGSGKDAVADDLARRIQDSETSERDDSWIVSTFELDDTGSGGPGDLNHLAPRASASRAEEAPATGPTFVASIQPPGENAPRRVVAERLSKVFPGRRMPLLMLSSSREPSRVTEEILAACQASRGS